MGSSVSGGFDSFKKFSSSRFAVKHLFVVESRVDGAELPSLFVLRGVFPFNEIQTFPLERDNSNVYYPELVDVADVEVELYETADNKVFDFFEEWYDMIFASNEKDDVVFNLPDLFKKTIYVFRLDTVGEEGKNEFTRVFGYEYSGCFPKRISDYPMDMSDPTMVTLSLTFSVDNVRRLKIGEGISNPNIGGSGTIPSADPSSLTTTGLANPVPKQNEDSLTPVEGVQGVDLGQKIQSKIQNKVREVKRSFTGIGLAQWAAALVKAAAETGINIAEIDAYRMAIAAGNRYPEIAGGVRRGGNIFRGTF